MYICRALDSLVGAVRGTILPVHPSTEDHRVDSVIFSAEV
jgi:hypothetical protein